MERANGGLTAREHLFCALLALLGEPLEAARRAGYPRGSVPREAVGLLGRADIGAQVEALRAGLDGIRRQDAALGGLWRAALGDVSDAVALALCDEAPTAGQLAGMDLFPVSEVRRRRDGTVEVKLVDRVQALKLLLEYTRSSGEPQELQALLTALDRGLEQDLAEQGGDAAEPTEPEKTGQAPRARAVKKTGNGAKGTAQATGSEKPGEVPAKPAQADGGPPHRSAPTVPAGGEEGPAEAAPCAHTPRRRPGVRGERGNARGRGGGAAQRKAGSGAGGGQWEVKGDAH